MLNLIIFGAPGSGKGTQSTFLEKEYNLYHISTGDVLREEIKKESATGKIAKEYIEKGHLVPDELIIKILSDVLDGASEYNGVIFDGFPRTVVQAEALTDLLHQKGQEIDLLIDLNVPEEELVERLLNRGKISGRSDDNETAIRERLKVYHSQTEPVVDYYKAKGKHLPIEGVGEIEEITKRIINGIEGALNSH